MADLLDIERMRYIEENLGPRYEREYVNDDAASSYHLECLQYLHENGYPWDERACAVAVEKGRLDCLEYLRENGCPEFKPCNHGYSNKVIPQSSNTTCPFC